MRKIFVIAAVVALSFSLSGCFFLAAVGAGAGGGYIYKEEQDKGKAPG